MLLGQILCWFFFGQSVLANILPQEVIRRADEIRNPAEAYLMRVEVLSEEKNSLFEVYLSGNDKTLIKTLAPERDRGRNLLMLGENMWAYVPNLKRAVRVSVAQKLTGDAANGDLARMRWSEDYLASLQEELSEMYIIFLKAQKKGLTYDQLRVWIEKKTYRPRQVEYLTISGKVIKTAQLQDYRQMAGKERPTMMVITDASKAGQETKILIKEMQPMSLPASLFQQQNLQ